MLPDSVDVRLMLVKKVQAVQISDATGWGPGGPAEPVQPSSGSPPTLQGRSAIRRSSISARSSVQRCSSDALANGAIGGIALKMI